MSIGAMKLYCDCCDLVQPVLIAPDRDAVTGEPYEDILCAECRLVIASGTGIKQSIEEVKALKQAMSDMITFGTAATLGGKRIAPEDFYKERTHDTL